MNKVTIDNSATNNTFVGLSDTPDTIGGRTDKVRVNVEGNKLESYEEDDDSGGNPLSFTFLSRLSNLSASQGVASDGKYIYTTGSYVAGTHTTISKWIKDGTLVIENTSARSDGTDMTQVNSIFIKDGKLYVGGNNYANPQVPAAQSYIKVFDATTLVFIEEFQVRNNINEGYVWHDGFWWGVYNDLMIVSKRDASFTLVTEYPLTYTITGGFNYQGIVWIDDYILVNVHDGAATHKFLDVYKWNGAGFDEVRRIDQINPGKTGQGIFKEPGKNILWWAERNYPNIGDNNIVKTRINYLISATND